MEISKLAVHIPLIRAVISWLLQLELPVDLYDFHVRLFFIGLALVGFVNRRQRYGKGRRLYLNLPLPLGLR